MINHIRNDLFASLCLVTLVNCVASATLSAQSEPIQPKSWTGGLATGPSFFYGDEGNTVGIQIESTLMRRLSSDRMWLRFEMTSHLYGTQRLYPCMLNVNGTCFSTSQRAVFGGGLGAQYFFRDRARSAGPVPHLVLGIATYVSTRKAEQPAVCQSSSLCPDVTPSHQFTDTDLGVNIGFGQTWSAGRNDFFIESRLHQPVLRQRRDAPYSGFRIFPLSIGVRF